MKYFSIILLILIVVLVIALGIAIKFRHNIRIWNDYSVYMVSKDYFNYKKNGGKYKDEFYGAINMDRYRDELMLGLTKNEILIKFPDAKPLHDYTPGSYRYDFIKYLNQNKVTEIIYLDGKSENDFGWAIELDKNGVGSNIILVKG